MKMLNRMRDKKDMPEHLIKPAIDLEKLTKIQENERMRLQNASKQGTMKRMSMGQQKLEQAINKNKSELKIKIKRADRNLKNFYAEIRKILDKQDEDQVMPNSLKTVQHSRVAELNGIFVSHIFTVFADATNDQAGKISKRVSK